MGTCVASMLLNLITILCTVSACCAATAEVRSKPFKRVFAFGDSFTDTGNTKNAEGPSGFGHVSNSPYGTTFFNHSTNRYSDGRLVIDFVAEALSLPYLPPYRHIRGNDTFGVNFAVAGSTAINHLFFVRNNLSLDITPQSIQTQIIWFNRYLQSQECQEAKCNDFDDTLFWFGEIGVNDYAYTLGSSVPDDTIRKLAISSVSGALQALLEKGAKYLVVQGLPLTGCLTLSMYLAPPDNRDEIGCVRSVNNQSYHHNLVLQAKLDEFRKQYPQAVILYADYYNAYRTVMKDPSKYGFKEVFDVCCGSGEPPYNFSVFATCGTPNATVCGNPSQYINWDGVHLTEAMYKAISNMFLQGNYTQPPFDFLLGKKERVG
ncbi:GDSL esterase/lipase At3g48460 [Cajanus cajan]|uniref:GDSL esterase/lipase At3g48460 family n=1 Tax=Cajanus cajan TaxID=3821 RepID=A0A151TE73_CAJCA|nr:GDSL esterase/lipase At3g48460 [Cajanus cajan]KYP65327.1 GDSL esterase/lipase At3g48460 family [Cajanus cajan]